MIRDNIQQAIFENLKAGKTTEVKVLRFILSQIKYAEIEKKGDLADSETVELLRKEVKKRKEAIELFKKGERSDLVQDETHQIKVIEQYLPQMISADELEKIVDETIAQNPDEKIIGKIIGLVISQVKGRADGQQVANLVREKLK